MQTIQGLSHGTILVPLTLQPILSSCSIKTEDNQDHHVITLQNNMEEAEQ